MNHTRLLVFPLDLDDAEAFTRIATTLGIEIVGASSAMSGPGNRVVKHFIRLPFVTDPAFDQALLEALQEYGITVIFAPHQGVWRHLERLLHKSSGCYHFVLCKPDPFTATSHLFSFHEDWANVAACSTVAEWIGGSVIQSSLSRSCYAALHRQFLSTPGDSDQVKLLALCDIARLLPPGDLLEVGCLYGRSALALGYLASRHRIGNLICIDPWSAAELTDQGMSAALLNVERFNIDFERVFRIFLSTAALLDNVGYIRKTTEAAHPVYETARRSGCLESPELSSIALSPHLSLLHVDGNHRYDQVWKDVETWSPYLVPGGWLLLDDYVWAFGDGPKRVGDELLESPLYDKAFVSGDTLFLRRGTTC